MFGAASSHTATVEDWLGLFDRRWPTEDELRAVLHPDAVFVERPNLLSPAGGERDVDAMVAGVAAGRALLREQRYEVRDHLADGDRVATRMRWTGELAIDAGPWPAGTVLEAWCVAHYDLTDDGRLRRIEHHDCYVTPA